MTVEKSHQVNALPKKEILWRGICGRCPCCGKGKLFKGYLRQVDTCAHCNENISSIRADDGPAWLTILLTGHIVAPMIAYFALHDDLPQWMAMGILFSVTLTAAFSLLPHAKGLFIAAIWLTSKKSDPSND